MKTLEDYHSPRVFLDDLRKLSTEDTSNEVIDLFTSYIMYRKEVEDMRMKVVTMATENYLLFKELQELKDIIDES